MKLFEYNYGRNLNLNIFFIAYLIRWKRKKLRLLQMQEPNLMNFDYLYAGLKQTIVFENDPFFKWKTIFFSIFISFFLRRFLKLKDHFSKNWKRPIPNAIYCYISYLTQVTKITSRCDNYNEFHFYLIYRSERLILKVTNPRDIYY